MASLAMAMKIAVIKTGFLTVFLGLNRYCLYLGFCSIDKQIQVIDHILFKGLASISGHKCFLNFLEVHHSCNGANNKNP